MSNPGVITLETFSIAPSLSVKIEDNLGESVHVHIGPLRLDLTLKQLKELAEDAELLIDFYLRPFGLGLENFDKEFLGKIANTLVDLNVARFEKVPVCDLLVTKKNRFGFSQTVSLKESQVISASRNDFIGYTRTFGISNELARKRIKLAENIAAHEQYGATGEYIVLFNDQMLIRDGQHRAAALYLSDPSAEVKVLRLEFNGRRHSIKQPLILNNLFGFKVIKIKLKILKSINYVKHIGRRILSKFNQYQNSHTNKLSD